MELTIVQEPITITEYPIGDEFYWMTYSAPEEEPMLVTVVGESEDDETVIITPTHLEEMDERVYQNNSVYGDMFWLFFGQKYPHCRLLDSGDRISGKKTPCDSYNIDSSEIE